MFKCLLQSFQSNFSFEILGVSTSISLAAKISSLWEPYLIETELKVLNQIYHMTDVHSKIEHVVGPVDPNQEECISLQPKYLRFELMLISIFISTLAYFFLAML